MFEVTIREILPDGSRVPVVRDGKEFPDVKLEGFALLGIEHSTDEVEDACTISLNIGQASLARMLSDGDCRFRASALMAAIRIMAEHKEGDVPDAAE